MLAAILSVSQVVIASGSKNSSAWNFCPNNQLVPDRPMHADPGINLESTEIRADNSRIVEFGRSQFHGNVEVIKGVQAIRAEVITYDKNTGLYDAEGRAHLWSKGAIWSGDSLHFNSLNETARLNDGQYWLNESPGRGKAVVIEHDSANEISILKNVKYTTCPVSNETWKLNASAIRIDHKNERASASNAIIRFRDIPVFYMPYINFPTSQKRKSGFLAPIFGTSNESGFDTQVPYYWNIAPTQDATIAPRFMQDRGVLIDTEYRYLNHDYAGSIDLEYLIRDRIKDKQDRSYIRAEHHHRIFKNKGRIDILFSNLSDDQYFQDFGTTIGQSSQSFMDRRAEFVYENASYYVSALTQAYQSVNRSLPAGAKPYQLLPKIEFRKKNLPKVFALQPNFEADFTYFNRDDSLTSIRTTVAPSISYDYSKSFIKVTPKFMISHTEYFNDDPASIYEDESRTVPVITLDTTLFAERDFSLLGFNLFQTLEPRIYYVYIPKVNQDNLPVFDTGTMDINPHTMYLPNRFSGGISGFGGDRIGDANRISAGINSRITSKETGRQFLAFNLGQVFHLEKREISLPNQTYSKNTLSSLFGGFELNPQPDLAIKGSFVWNPKQTNFERKAISLDYEPNSNALAKIAYRFTRAPHKNLDNIKQTDAVFRLPINSLPDTSIIGLWSYSIEEKRTIEAFGGLEYESCCWGLRVIGQRYLNGNKASGQSEYVTGVFIQVRLRGLGGLGKGRDPLTTRYLPEATSQF
ncbi:MAG: LPS-assembly protein LptD [Pseudohongiellaceae bacterium]